MLGLATLCLALAVAYVFLINVGGDATERDVNLQLTSGQGETSWRMIDGFSGMPILCGCQDPTGHQFGVEGTPWEGTLLPADEFSLSVDGPERWALHAIAPDSGPASWDGSGVVPLELKITIQPKGDVGYQWEYSVALDKKKYISPNGVYGLTMEGFKFVDFDVDDRWPLASVKGPSGALTAVKVESGARPFEAAAASLVTDVPKHVSRAPGGGVILNVANGASLTAIADADSRIVVGSRVFDVLVPGTSVQVELASPIGPTQVMVFPATDSWLRQLESVTRGGTEVTKVDMKSDRAPEYNVVNPAKDSLPPYVVRMDSLLTPSESEWRAFLKRATPKKTDEPTGLPPLPVDRRIEVFGPIKEVVSGAMTGSVSVDSQTWAITQADPLQIRSDHGLRTGNWTPSLSLSIGSTLCVRLR